MKNSYLIRACAKADKHGKLMEMAIGKRNWTREKMKALGLNPDSGIDREFFKEINS